jgi:RNA polymerase sigma-70 factor (ECF subfamily)
MDSRDAMAEPGPDHGARLTGFFEESADELMGTLYFMLGDREDARDAVQETFLKCWRARAGLGEVRDLRAWVFKVALGVARDARRSAWRRKSRPLPEDETVLTAMTTRSAEPASERAETIRRVRRAIERLPEGEREVFLLRENGELSYEEIAAMSGTPLGTVKTRMRSALARLRRALALPEGSLKGETP